MGDGVADPRLGDLLDPRDDHADLAGGQGLDLVVVGRKDTDLLNLEVLAGRHQPDRLAAGQPARHHPHQHHHAAEAVVPAVEDQRRQRRRVVAVRRWDPLDDRLENFGDSPALLRADRQRVVGGETDDLVDLLLDRLGIGARQIYLVKDRDDLEVAVHRQVDVGHRLGLDPLAGVHHQQRPLAGGQAPRDLVLKVDVAGGVDQVELVGLAVGGGVVEAHRLGFDRDPPLPLEVHLVEELIDPLPLGDRLALLEQPVGQRALAVVDVSDDREVSDQLFGGHLLGAPRSRGCRGVVQGRLGPAKT